MFHPNLAVALALLVLECAPHARALIDDTTPPSILACAPSMTVDVADACSVAVPDLTL